MGLLLFGEFPAAELIPRPGKQEAVFAPNIFQKRECGSGGKNCRNSLGGRGFHTWTIRIATTTTTTAAGAAAEADSGKICFCSTPSPSHIVFPTTSKFGQKNQQKNQELGPPPPIPIPLQGKIARRHKLFPLFMISESAVFLCRRRPPCLTPHFPKSSGPLTFALAQDKCELVHTYKPFLIANNESCTYFLKFPRKCLSSKMSVFFVKKIYLPNQSMT